MRVNADRATMVLTRRRLGMLINDVQQLQWRAHALGCPRRIIGHDIRETRLIDTRENFMFIFHVRSPLVADHNIIGAVFVMHAKFIHHRRARLVQSDDINLRPLAAKL